jgi:hypothetical protein
VTAGLLLLALVAAIAGCGGSDDTTRAQPPSGKLPQGSPDEPCPLAEAGSRLPISMPGCKLVASDTAADPDPTSFWGLIDCGSAEQRVPSRHRDIRAGGDPGPTATGARQGNDAFRRLTVLDGDDISGERCELGFNDNRRGPTVFYRQGMRRATYVSLRLPPNLPIGVDTWQNVLQMKQTQPADGGGDVPIFYFGARDNEWFVESSNGIYAKFPARHGVWTRFGFDVFYSQEPDQGRLQVSADLNADDDFDDPGERTPVIDATTLKTEIEGPNGTSDGLAPGDPIPSHLRVGVYHDPSIPCPAPGGCSVEVDNVQVMKAPGAP